jgi:hypothetical protein
MVRPQAAATKTQAPGARPPATPTRPQAAATRPQVPATPPRVPVGQQRAAYRPTQYQPSAPYYLPQEVRNHPGSQSVLRHRPSPYAYDSGYGYRNPGGVGKFEEYYPPGNQFQNGGHDPTVAASFEHGTPYNIQEQAMATNVGTNRYRALQQHLDNFGRPVGFYGFGLGLGGRF